MKTSELTGALLDYWVAKADGREIRTYHRDDVGIHTLRAIDVQDSNLEPWMQYCPSTDWARGGPIIERERIAVVPMNGKWCAFLSSDVDRHNGAYEGGDYIDTTDDDADGTGPDGLTAAMRCFVASVFGDTVPDESTPPDSTHPKPPAA